MKTIIALMMLFSINVNSQTKDTLGNEVNKLTVLKDTSYKCTIVTDTRSIYKDIKLFSLKDSTVKFFKDDVTGSLDISNIRTVKFKGKGFWTGAAVGMGFGFLVSAIVAISGGIDVSGHGSSDVNFSEAVVGGFILGIPFALIGGGIGSLFAEDKFYDLSGYSFIKKRNKLGYLMKDNPDR